MALIKIPLKKIVYFLPLGYLKLRLIANYRWPFLEKERREKIVDIVILREINKFNLTSVILLEHPKNRTEKIFTVPTINVIENIIIEYGRQENLFENISSHLAIFKMTGLGILQGDLMETLRSLYLKRDKILKNGFFGDTCEKNLPCLFYEANRALREVEKSLYEHYKSHHTESECSPIDFQEFIL
ncbi:hypothetical protein Flexsi_1137 [Flexistipes sinusarabici DSM 4947]|uniref:Uncharacterized protein n=1 Tax=Flexistipes sinusarabici (strain ATCC 49648 / DSM 4947 / MAS 10) TaxID=717231 RepID=F8E6F6_FLESM|nr:hypothetical protein [Flexistipes sinusarabici]AEI14793.1 hypothetical protein Flexsi_1137 [Flexistipes sinusarabici DSM 4947]